MTKEFVETKLTEYGFQDNDIKCLVLPKSKLILLACYTKNNELWRTIQEDNTFYEWCWEFGYDVQWLRSGLGNRYYRG